MSELGGLIALPDGSLVRGRVSFSSRIDSMSTGGAASEDYILPGFVDLQVNGSHGIDVMAARPDGLAAMARHLAREGTTAFLPTVITSPIEQIERVHEAIAGAMNDRGEDGAAILGMHLEGPFISAKRLGAHPPRNLEPRGEALDRTRKLRALRLVTLAPELPGALDATRALTTGGVAVSIGHTDATLEEARAGIVAGARMFTHLFNAMRPLNHRDPGVVAAALTESPAMPALIPDGVHVHPDVMRLAFRARGAAGTILTTDKILFAGLTPAEAEKLGRGRASIVDGAACLANGTLAGSIISMLDGVRLMVSKIGATVGEAARMAATNPAGLIGVRDRGRIAVGAHADMIVLSPALDLKAVYIGGRALS
jgi:N-acetylglucosamine-6-phosphate deacetylase